MVDFWSIVQVSLAVLSVCSCNRSNGLPKRVISSEDKSTALERYRKLVPWSNSWRTSKNNFLHLFTFSRTWLSQNTGFGGNCGKSSLKELHLWREIWNNLILNASQNRKNIERVCNSRAENCPSCACSACSACSMLRLHCDTGLCRALQAEEVFAEAAAEMRGLTEAYIGTFWYDFLGSSRVARVTRVFEIPEKLLRLKHSCVQSLEIVVRGMPQAPKAAWANLPNSLARRLKFWSCELEETGKHLSHAQFVGWCTFRRSLKWYVGFLRLSGWHGSGTSVQGSAMNFAWRWCCTCFCLRNIMSTVCGFQICWWTPLPEETWSNWQDATSRMYSAGHDALGAWRDIAEVLECACQHLGRCRMKR